MPTYSFHTNDDVGDESKYDILFILDDKITYVEPLNKRFDPNTLERLILKAVSNKNFDGTMNRLFCVICKIV